MRSSRIRIIPYTVILKITIIASIIFSSPGLPRQNRYVGSHTCSKCHSDNFDKWKTSAHAHPAPASVPGKEQCHGCHATGQVTTGAYPIELDVGCEECHGPGGDHLLNPKKVNIISPAALEFARGNEICLACHTRGISKPGLKNWPDGYQPGDNLSAIWQPVVLENDSQNSDFTSSGTASRRRMPGNEYLSTIKWRKQISCFACHAPHGSENKGSLVFDACESNVLCVSCHNNETGIPPELNNITEHTQHKAIGRGSLCIECHMPLIPGDDSRVERRSHYFTFVVPGKNQGIREEKANACLHCHNDKNVVWVINVVQAWRRVKVMKK